MSASPGRSAAPAPVLDGLRDAATALEALGVPVPPLDGKLLRPTVAWASVPEERRSALDRRFWLGALAVQMVHEASLLHDDILDDAATRRGRETLAARRGVAAALVTGDHWLTAAYRAASLVGSPTFMDVFTRAVERTVAGEVAQNRAAGRALHEAEYDDIVRGKSGELFGAVTALPAALAGRPVDAAREVGLRLGALYQRVDDFLDYCPAADHGKPPLQDYRQGKWTWVLGEAGIHDLGAPRDAVRRALHRDEGPSGSALAACLGRLRLEADEVVRAHAALVGPASGPRPLEAVVGAWVRAAARGLAASPEDPEGEFPEAEASDEDAPDGEAPGGEAPGGEDAGGTDGAAGTVPPGSPVWAARGVAPLLETALAARARALGGPRSWPARFGRHARTFRFASRLFPAWAAERVAEVYVFCRFTDDLADEAAPETDPALVRARLDAWRDMALRAHRGERTGVPLLDVVMGRMAAEGVPFRYVDALVDGVRSDAGPVRMADSASLERYTWRVASVVGGWLTRLFGVRDPALLERAYRLGHAMQLTNILRDVGEDWRAGRVYLPLDLLARHGLDETDVGRVAAGAVPLPPPWPRALEELMAEADRAYDDALAAVPALPRWYGRPVAVAARAYQAIHDEIRRNGYDNGTRRAHTSLLRKGLVGARALMEIRRLERSGADGTGLRPLGTDGASDDPTSAPLGAGAEPVGAHG